MERKLNIELLKKVRDRIRDTPQSYDQEHYHRRSDSAPCGTAACLAGETIICAAPTVAEGVKQLKRFNYRSTVPQRAAKLLGLPSPKWSWDTGGRNEAGVLFDAFLADDGVSTVAWPALPRLHH